MRRAITVGANLNGIRGELGYVHDPARRPRRTAMPDVAHSDFELAWLGPSEPVQILSVRSGHPQQQLTRWFAYRSIFGSGTAKPLISKNSIELHIRMVLSSDADTMNRSSGANATERTGAACARRVAIAAPVTASYI